MRVVKVYGALYLQALHKTGEGLRRNAWTLLLPMLLTVGAMLAGMIVAPLGLIGGFVLGFVMAALTASYLYFLSEIVAGSPVKFEELKQSFGPYLWSVINVLFIFFVVRLAVTLLGGGSAGILMLALTLVAMIAFNALPETLYIRGTYNGLDTLRSSFEFLRDNLLAWAIPNVPAVALLIFGLPIINAIVVRALFGVLPMTVVSIVLSAIAGVFIHVAMIFRGHLYKELAGTTHRQRMFRYGSG